MSTIIVKRNSVKKGFLLERPVPEGPTHRVPYDCHNPVHLAAISEWNSQNSPFLKLPAELKNRNYEEAFTGHTVHIFQRLLTAKEFKASSGKGRFFRREQPLATSFEFGELVHTICQEPCMDELCRMNLGAWMLCQAPSDSIEYSVPRKRGDFMGCEEYGVCSANMLTIFKALEDLEMPEYANTIRRMFRRTQLPLQLLRVCREIWTDARVLPYTENTFSFHSAETLNYFKKRAKAIGPSPIRSLRLTKGAVDPSASGFPFLSELKINNKFPHVGTAAEPHEKTMAALLRCTPEEWQDVREREDPENVKVFTHRFTGQ